MKVIAIDPGTRYVGWAIFEPEPPSGTLLNCGLIKPEGKDIGSRLRSIHTWLLFMTAEHSRLNEDPEICYEEPATAQDYARGHARGAKSRAHFERSIGVVQGFGGVAVEPLRIRGRIASKRTRQNTCQFYFPDAIKMMDRDKIAKSQREHVWDAICVGAQYVRKILTQRRMTDMVESKDQK